MKFRILLVLTVVCAFLLSGCSFINMEPRLQSEAKLAPDAMGIWGRPAEYGVEELGDVEGRASCVYLFMFWPIAGDTVSLDIPVISTPAVALDRLGMVAAAHAIDRKPGADGLYISRTAKSGQYFLIFSRKEVSVKGKALKLKNLGVISEERADRIRALRALTGAGETTLVPPSETPQTLSEMIARLLSPSGTPKPAAREPLKR
jgi:hypothetical protein